jgi:hypothetical protein
MRAARETARNPEKTLRELDDVSVSSDIKEGDHFTVRASYRTDELGTVDLMIFGTPRQTSITYTTSDATAPRVLAEVTFNELGEHQSTCTALADLSLAEHTSFATSAGVIWFDDSLQDEFTRGVLAIQTETCEEACARDSKIVSGVFFGILLGMCVIWGGGIPGLDCTTDAHDVSLVLCALFPASKQDRRTFKGQKRYPL